jgi:hypothetical protein
MIVFYKGVLKSQLKHPYVPGTVTKDFNEALVWKERINSKKSKGAAKHVQHGESVVIEILYDDSNNKILSAEEFQRQGISEHSRVNCWTAAAQVKAQINTPCEYRILSKEEQDKLFSL